MTADLENKIIEASKQIGLSFVEWKDKNCVAWYLNSQAEDEALFEDYLDYLKENGFDYDDLNHYSSLKNDIERE